MRKLRCVNEINANEECLTFEKLPSLDWELVYARLWQKIIKIQPKLYLNDFTIIYNKD